ncbi:hypothetical protein NW759_009904 [Fusarium solani]|nr:hypothetical protein NW759_009904 [Fusarium solani]
MIMLASLTTTPNAIQPTCINRFVISSWASSWDPAAIKFVLGKPSAQPPPTPTQMTHHGQMPRRMNAINIIMHLYEKRLLKLSLQELTKSIRVNLLAEDDLWILNRVSRLVRLATTSAWQYRGQQVHESAPVFMY